ncbi:MULTISPECIES: methylmalonyl-CoA mutase family protein [unclassified Bacillus (in: firmicutes)]|uniref:methylmalonyl-CoA mutase family protein n=1 Tax=unclassified Bacillus (in: firmicutes) TaxID=185979 RepID=UPI001BE58861|nr:MULTISPECIES: methylmalonyl-CoA mutase family protein [unclassified Bacillus (in: firmicutes)]MBT2617240.1 methylmalonyl-CoA mutase [Bacillus sp. ISL-78]MBT2627825.1 methylmalonyl-CoA mutase [Bacillus sp. ISL-101]
MGIQEMTTQRFPKVTLDEWAKVAEISLKGKSLKDLHTKTYENITLKPLYGPHEEASARAEQYPGVPDYTRGFLKGGYIEQPWKNAQSLVAESVPQLQEKFSYALQSGQNALSFDVEEMPGMTFTQFSEMISAFPTDTYPLYINTKDHFLAIASFLLKIEANKVSGAVGTDLISLYAGKGLVPGKQALTLQYEAIEQLNETFPKLRTIRIDTVPYHEAGANAFQEIAIALAEAVFYVELLKEKGWSPSEVAEKIHFHFAIGSQFFIETAKLRAFRKAWTVLCNSYGIIGESVKVPISAETSTVTLSKLDRHVNILRTGSEAFSALVGGVEYLQVSPFDKVTGNVSTQSERIAKNIPLILKHESHIGKVVDPCGGSYFIETLTEELSHSAWRKFIQIEEDGGIIAVLELGTLQKDLAAVMEKRNHDLAVRKKSMIGTNIYADLGERVPKTKKKMNKVLAEAEASSFHDLIRTINKGTTLAELHVKNNGRQVIPIKGQRLAEPFELLRERAEKIQASGNSLEVGLICLGRLKEYKPRADFVTGVLSTGGISAKWSGVCQSVEEAVKFVKESDLSYYCICGKDETYEQFGPQIVGKLKQAGVNLQIDLAGRLSDEAEMEWKKSGVKGYIYAGQNVLKKLTALLKFLEGDSTYE